MRLYFSTDHVRNSVISNASGQVIYKVTTPFKPFWQTAVSTVWKIAPNSTPLHYGPNHASGRDAEVESDEEDAVQESESDPVGHDDGGGESSADEHDKIDDVDMQDRFHKLAVIEWHKLSTSRIQWFGGQAALGEVDTKDFIPASGVTRRTRIFTGPDGRSYRWRLGFRVCTLYLASDNGSKNPIARYHRFKTGLVRGKEPQHGYLEFMRQQIPTESASKADAEVDLDNYTDHELEQSLSHVGGIDTRVLDMIVVTFIYCEKLRRDRERAGKKDLRWNF